LKEEQIAALDGDWSEFPPNERAAFTLAHKLTFELNRFGDADIDRLREYYKDLQILEMVLSIAGNNSINRWKEGAGIPQSKESSSFLRQRADRPVPKDRPLPIKTYLTPTPEQYRNKITKVAPFVGTEEKHDRCPLPVSTRRPLEPRSEVERILADGRKRTPRLPLVDESKARSILPADWPTGPLPQWVRLLANFPREGRSRILGQHQNDEKGKLSPMLKAQVSWIIARQDGAWYAVGQAYQRLRDLGWSDDQVFTLDGDWKDFTPAERASFTLARQLAASPIVLTDAQVEQAVRLTSPRDVVQLIQYTADRALFDRVTEAAGLQVGQ
jgi:alkylhydroperoxidase family enzyme